MRSRTRSRRRSSARVPRAGSYKVGPRGIDTSAAASAKIQLRCGLVEVTPTGRVDPAQIRAEFDAIEVFLQDLRLAQTAFDAERNR